jgi:hypothetical protein
VHFEDFPKLLDEGNFARATHAVDELLRAGILQQRDAYYVLSQAAFASALIRSVGEDARKRAHGRLALIFSGPGYKASWVAVRQMLAAGDHAAARRTILQFATLEATARVPDWGTMRVSLHAQCSREAVDHWQAEQGSLREGIILRRVLMTAVTVYDWRLASYGAAQLAQVQSDCGWKYWEQTDPALPALQRISECLKRAQQDHDATPESARGLSPLEAIRELAGCSTLLSRIYAASSISRRCSAYVLRSRRCDRLHLRSP